MALPRSTAPARMGRPLSATVVLPAVALAVLIALATALLVSGSGTRAANKELDARAATVKKEWDGAGRPSSGGELQRLGRRLNAQLRVVRGQHRNAGTTSGDVRSYSFATGVDQTLRVKLSAKQSSDAISHGLLAGLVVGLVGALLLGVLLSAVLRSSVSRPLSAVAAALAKIKGGNATRAPINGAREVRVAANAFNELADRAAELDRAAGTDPLTGLPSGPRVRQAL